MEMAELKGFTSATVVTIILAFRKNQEMKKRVGKAKGTSSTHRRFGIASRQIRFRADESFIITRHSFLDAHLTLECTSRLIISFV